MTKSEMIMIRVDGDVKRLIENAAKRRGRSMSGFVLETALKEAVSVENSAPRSDQEGVQTPEPVGGVPAFFRACCETARAGGTNGYTLAGYHLARRLDQIIPVGIEHDEWIERLERLEELIWPNDPLMRHTKTIARSGYEQVAVWFDHQFPVCMKMIPKRRRDRFVFGVVECVRETDGVPGASGFDDAGPMGGRLKA